jgi:two-component system CheB/CheR fusion protein
VVAEALGTGRRGHDVRIFATDVDEAALRRARRGTYPAAALHNVPKAYRERYFACATDTVEVASFIRGMLLFTSQDLIRDPPFSRVDLISCRNLLFYLGDALHQRLFPMFHHILRPRGILFLGAAEAAPEDGLFEPADRSSRIYLRRPGATRGPLILPTYRPLARPGRQRGAAGRLAPEITPHEALQRHLAGTYGPAAVLINHRFEILQVHGDVRAFLALQPGAPGLSILSLAEASIRHHLRAALCRATSERTAVCSTPIPFERAGERSQVVISARPLEGDGLEARSSVVTFELQQLPPQLATGDAALRLTEVERQLQVTRETLEVAVEELATANQELQALNEELQCCNEELQTSNEGLQSVNEQLIAVNDALQIKEQSLSAALTDIASILSSVGLPMLVLDNELAIKHYTTEASEILALRAVDIGQPVTRVPRLVDLPDLEQTLTQVIRQTRA